MRTDITHASLFSGIGGGELAASWMGWTNLFHCETNEFCKRVLKFWFPESTGYDDIRTTDFTAWRGRVNVLTGGFPCQPFSSAGRRRGAEDDRYLWPQMLRAIREIQPAWVVGENVAGLATMVQPGETVDLGRSDNIFEANHLYRTTQRFTFDEIICSLEDCGYSVQPFLVPACAVGAPHRRDRLWIVANRTDARIENQSARSEQSDSVGLVANSFNAGVRTPGHGGQHNPGEGQDRPFNRFDQLGDKRFAPDATSDRRRKIHQDLQPEQPDGEESDSGGLQWAASFATSIRRNHAFTHDDGELNPSQEEECGKLQLIGTDCPQDWWRQFPSVPPVCRGNDGLSFDLARLSIPEATWRKEAIKAMGNAFVPQVMYEIFWAIQKECESTQPCP